MSSEKQTEEALVTTVEWVVTESAPVSAFVSEGDPIPDPRGYADGYAIAVGSDAERRVRLEKRTR